MEVGVAWFHCWSDCLFSLSLGEFLFGILLVLKLSEDYLFVLRTCWWYFGRV